MLLYCNENPLACVEIWAAVAVGVLFRAVFFGSAYVVKSCATACGARTYGHPCHDFGLRFFAKYNLDYRRNYAWRVFIARRLSDAFSNHGKILLIQNRGAH